MRWLVAWVVIALASVMVLVASAHPYGPRVVIVGPSHDHPTVTRVTDELGLLGFEVRVVVSSAAVGDLASVGRQHHAAAVAYIEDWPPEIIIWIDSGSEAGVPPVPELRVSDSLTESASPELLALRAVELLRGRLLPVPTADPTLTAAPATSAAAAPTSAPSSTTTAPAAAAPAAAATSRPAPPDSGDGWHVNRGSVFFAPVLMLDPGAPAGFDALLGGYYPLGWRIGAEIVALIPITAATVGADEGEVDVRTCLLGGGLTLRFTEDDSDFASHLGLGAATALLVFDGTAAEPYAGQQDTAWTAALFAELMASYRVHPNLAIRGEALVALLQPEPVVRIAGQEIASIGQPAVALALGLEVLP